MLVGKYGSSIRAKIIIVWTIIISITFLFVGFQQANIITKVVEEEAIEKAKSDLNMGLALIDRMYPGSWNVKNGMLYKAATTIHEMSAGIQQIASNSEEVAKISAEASRASETV